jgi:hypothetical protein
MHLTLMLEQGCIESLFHLNLVPGCDGLAAVVWCCCRCCCVMLRVGPGGLRLLPILSQPNPQNLAGVGRKAACRLARGGDLVNCVPLQHGL